MQENSYPQLGSPGLLFVEDKAFNAAYEASNALCARCEGCYSSVHAQVE